MAISRKFPNLGIFDPFDQFSDTAESSGAPAETFYILTETGNPIITEAGNFIVQE